MRKLITLSATLVAVLLALVASSALHAGGGGLIAAYAFDDGGGTTVRDASGQNNTGSTLNTAWSTSGRFGGALTFNGSSSLVSVPDSTSLDLTTGFTVEAWVKPAAAMGAAWQTIAIKEQPGDFVYGLYANSNTSVPAGVAFAAGGKQDSRGTSALQPNVWTHVATTWDGAVLRLYVNGTQVSSRAVTGSMPASTGALRIGGNGVRGEWFNGQLDDLRIYDRALTVARISSDMTTPVSPPPPPPPPDTTAPSSPALFAAAGVTTSSIATSWTASTDNVAVAGYHVFLDGVNVATTSVAAFTFAGLSCGTSHSLAVEAFDAAGNLSIRPSITATTSVCPDTTPPSTPSSFIAGAIGPTSISTSWAPSTDNVAVAGYTVYRNGVSAGTIPGAIVATAAAGSFTFAGLSCGTSYLLGIEAFDAAGNTSLRQSITGSTTPCPDTTPPQVALAAPAAGATISGSVQLAANATDAGGVASVQFTLDGANIGAALTSLPYTLAWDSLGAANGPHTLGAHATDTSGNASNAPAIAVTVQNTLVTTNAFKRVDIGPGFVDASLRGVIRTGGGRVYVFVPDDTAERKGTGPGVMHAYRADQLGIPTSFTEVDALHRPSATGITHVIGAPDVRLASNGVAHMVYTDETNATLWYETFSTVTDTWGVRQSLATGVDIPTQAIKREASNALVLDASDVPHVAYAAGSVVQYRNRAGGVWSTPTTVSSGGTPIHVGLAAAPDGTIDLTWLQDGVAPSIGFAQRSSVGAWSAPETVAGTDVLNNSNADQGPSVALDSASHPYVLYVSASKGTFGPVGHTAAYGATRIKERIAGVWTFDNPTPDALTHTPQLYLHGNDVYAFLGHDTQIRFGYTFQPAGQPWSAYAALTSTLDGPIDGSASLRFDPLHETNAGVIDATFFDEDLLNNKTYFPEAYYMAVLPGAQASADTTAPTVSLTAPAAGATVSGAAVALSAGAADNLAVAGVQFKLDGANLGVEDTSAPYSINWDSTTTANGLHALTAVARDAAGNTATATSITVTSSNAGAPPPPPPGTILLGNAATEANPDSNTAGSAEAFKTTAILTGTVTQLRVFVDTGSTAGSIVVGLYSNSGTGHPGTLLTTGTITAPAVAQGNQVAVTAAAVTAGQTYWIAVLSPTGTIRFRDRTAVGAGASETSSQATLTSLPAAWTTGLPFADGLLSAVGIG